MLSGSGLLVPGPWALELEPPGVERALALPLVAEVLRAEQAEQ